MNGSGEAFEFGRRVVRSLPSELAAVADGSVAELLAGIRADTAELNAVEARRLARISELYRVREEQVAVRAVGSAAGRFIDDWDLLTAEVGAALAVTRGPAAARVHQAVDLRERLPEVFALFARGVVTWVHAVAVVRAGAAIVDEAVCLEFDRRVAAALGRRLANPNTVLTARAVGQVAGKILAGLDPDAVGEDPPAAPKPRLSFSGSPNGMCVLEGVLSKADAIRLSALCSEVAETVCRKDGRGHAEREMAGLVALVEGYESLGCRCGNAACEWAERRPRTGAVAQDLRALAVIVLADADYLADADGRETPDGATRDGAAARNGTHGGAGATDGAAPGGCVGDDAAAGPVGDVPVESDLGAPPAGAAPDGAAPDSAAPTGTAEGGVAMVVTSNPDLAGPVPARQARELIEQCDCRITALGRRHPDGTVHVTGAAGYRPTEYQLLVMRLRYPHCVFVGCTVPSSRCQADHVAEYDAADPAAGGPTSVAGGNTGAGNLVPLCGFHHRIKTESGWLSDVLPDGAVEWRHPAGGVWIVDPGTSAIAGMDRIVWDVRHAAPASPPDPNAIDGDARRRNRERRRLRELNRRQRLERQPALDAAIPLRSGAAVPSDPNATRGPTRAVGAGGRAVPLPPRDAAPPNGDEGPPGAGADWPGDRAGVVVDLDAPPF